MYTAQRWVLGTFDVPIYGYMRYLVLFVRFMSCKNSNPCKTPIDTESKLGSDDDPVSDPTLYRSLAVHLRYVCGTLDYGLQLHVSSTTQLTAYTDADWAGCPVTRRSTSRYCVFLGDNLLSGSAKYQVTLSRSSVEAEFRSVANVVAETAWIRNMLLNLKDLLSIIVGSIHHKVIDEGGYGNDIIVGVDLILANILVFSPKPLMHHLNITMINVVKVFHKDTLPESESGVGKSEMLDKEEIMKLLEEEMAELELQVCRNVTN
nr:ribonuclease H-like domain-containing protein [Tanacetum cinerariifolium]